MDYVCVVNFESAKHTIAPQRRGILLSSYMYDGKPLWSEAIIPSEGPVLSPADIEPYYKKNNAEVEARRANRGARR